MMARPGMVAKALASVRISRAPDRCLDSPQFWFGLSLAVLPNVPLDGIDSIGEAFQSRPH
jgi:hypothetical protein